MLAIHFPTVDASNPTYTTNSQGMFDSFQSFVNNVVSLLSFLHFEEYFRVCRFFDQIILIFYWNFYALPICKQITEINNLYPALCKITIGS
jgi:hypothetical protein